MAQPPTHIRHHGETASCNVLYEIGAAGQKEHVCRHSGVCRWGSGTPVNHRNGGQECIKGTREMVTHGSRHAERDQIQRSSQLEENARLWKLMYARAGSTEKWMTQRNDKVWLGAVLNWGEMITETLPSGGVLRRPSVTKYWFHRVSLLLKTKGEAQSILLGCKKEGNSDTWYNMDEPWDVMLSDIGPSTKDKYCCEPGSLPSVRVHSANGRRYTQRF